MGDVHSRSFFGQATGMIIRSSSKTDDFIFVNCIKKKPDGSWEKPTQKEGKTVRLSLEEIIMILQAKEINEMPISKLRKIIYYIHINK